MTTHPYRQVIPEEILALSHERDLLRRKGNYARADVLKQQLEDAGYAVKDNPHGAHLVILPSIFVDGTQYRTIHQLPSLLEENDQCTFSVNILARNNSDQARRCVESVLKFAGTTSIEVMLIDNSSQDGFDIWAEALHHRDARVHVLRSTRKMGIAEAYNIGFLQSRGNYILLLDTAIELTGDIFTPLAQTLSDPAIGLTGPRGLITDDMRHFEESEEIEVEVIDGRCMAFRRPILKKAGLLDEGYRYSEFMDVDFSFAIRDSDKNTLRTPDLALTYHPETQETGLSSAEQTRLTKRNFYRYLSKWGDRDDLILEGHSIDEDDEGDENEDDEV
jgi:GT2 family glycosyltransferase